MLAVVPVREGVLPAGGLEAIAECGGRVVLIGSNVASAAAEVGEYATELTTYAAGTYSPGGWASVLAAALAHEPQLVLPASPDGRDLAPRLAFELRRELFAGAISVASSRVQLVRSGGLAIHDVHPAEPFVATLQPGVRGVEQRLTSDDVIVTELDPLAMTEADGVIVVEVLPPDAATMDLAESPRIVGGGAGLHTKEMFDSLAALASALDASMGATRVITDRGWVGHERQIGTTGVVVDPDVYVAFGISGAVQHTSGLGSPEHIISVNTDPHCPMMQLADLAIVSDANDVVLELLVQLGQGDHATSGVDSRG